MKRGWAGVLLFVVITSSLALLASSRVSVAEGPIGDARLSGGGSMCEQVYSGTITSTYRICSADPYQKIGGQLEAHLPTYDLWVKSPQAAACITIMVASRISLPIQAPYPVQQQALPQEVLQFLQPSELIPSGHPDIRLLAVKLSSAETRQDRVVANIVAWVHTHVTVTTAVVNDDALVVLHSRTGTDRGLANLATALLRAAGVPAQVITGGILDYIVLGKNWQAPAAGDYHYWLMAYYPDVGWIPSDPQTEANWVDTAHIMTPFLQLGFENVMVTRVSHQETVTLTEQLAHIYGDTLVNNEPVTSAAAGEPAVLAWSPASINVALPLAQPTTAVTLTVASLRCDSAWTLTSSAPWLTVTQPSGTLRTAVRLEIDAAGLTPGWHYAYLTLSTDSAPGLPPLTSTIPVTLLLADTIYSLHLPLITNP